MSVFTVHHQIQSNNLQHHNDLYIKKLSVLEASIEKSKSDVRYYTPRVLPIGLTGKNVGEFNDDDEDDEDDDDDDDNEDEAEDDDMDDGNADARFMDESITDVDFGGVLEESDSEEG